ncbi:MULTISPECIES: DUF4389 domain-containing protein [Sulfurovum]|uniref:DUF4389 domain-containing protein n=1 Tax=Sulfurovum xiamenensis TaxID=3019066 RepID=A0ABT7QRP0_9BACT|nr:MULTISPECIES: DUF4389 domain-containing protein [Sulfurovum]EIF50044.1 putative lipase [Sulfurovum sp. AR]MDM5263760.1 DUF4389 domain-containing protein [Sulfurovum xiamenensis]
MEEIETNEREKPGIARAVYILLYLIIGRFISMVLFVVAITQFIYTWLSGEPNEKILQFTEGLSEYAKQLVSYVGFNSDEKPWPFGDWPDV